MLAAKEGHREIFDYLLAQPQASASTAAADAATGTNEVSNLLADELS